MRNVLVTGATGFIGKHFVHHLLQHNYAVRALLRDDRKKHELPSTVEIVIGDLTQPTTLQDACTGIDIVFHLGGYAHAWEECNSAFADQHHAVNCLGTQHILTAAVHAKVKAFVHFSSVKAVADSQHCVDETWDKQPNSPYGIAKRAAEQWVLAASSADLHTTVIRPALVYGPAWKGNLGNMLRAIDRGLFPPLPETFNRRSLVGVTDLCRAALLAAEHPNANGNVYFVTDGITYSTRQLYTLMAHALDKRVPRWHIPFGVFRALAYCGDLGKKILKRRLPFDSATLTKLFGSAEYSSRRIEQELGFRPTQHLKTLLPEIIAAYEPR